MDKKLSTFRIALENVKVRQFRSIGLGLVVALFAFTVFGGSLLAASLSSGINSLSGRLGADILIVPYGYEDKVEGSLLRGEPSTFYIKGDLADKIREVEGVDRVAPQLFVATLNSYCCSYPVQIIGYDPVQDFVIKNWVSQVLKEPLKDGEIIVGSKLSGNPGEYIEFYGQLFKVAVRLEDTGMGFDTSVFMTLETARNLLKTAGIAPGEMDMDFLSSLMVKVTDGYEVKYVANLLMQKFALEYTLDVVAAKNMITGISLRLKDISMLLRGAAVMLWLAAFGLMAVVFSVMLNERKKEFSLLRILGASKNKLIHIILTEAVIISLAGAVAGIAAACLVLFPFSNYISARIGLPYLQPETGTVIRLMTTGLAAALVVGPLSCLGSVVRLARSDLISTARSGE